jgi:hypothetical protein
MLAEREQLKETLAAGPLNRFSRSNVGRGTEFWWDAESEKAYLHFLGEVSAHYPVLRDATNKLAIFGELLAIHLPSGTLRGLAV